jgi:hypothetical protein
MGDQMRSFSRCAQVRIKIYRKDYNWYVGLVYDPTGLSGVTTAMPGVAGVLQCTPSTLPPFISHKFSVVAEAVVFTSEAVIFTSCIKNGTRRIELHTSPKGLFVWASF